MAKHRIDRINEEIKRELSEILREIKDPRLPKMMSVMKADATADLKFCKVFISFFGCEDEKEALSVLENAAGFIRREIGARINLRFTPEFTFYADHSIEHGAKITKILKEIVPKDDTHDS